MTEGSRTGGQNEYPPPPNPFEAHHEAGRPYWWIPLRLLRLFAAVPRPKPNQETK